MEQVGPTSLKVPVCKQLYKRLKSLFCIYDFYASNYQLSLFSGNIARLMELETEALVNKIAFRDPNTHTGRSTNESYPRRDMRINLSDPKVGRPYVRK